MKTVVIKSISIFLGLSLIVSLITNYVLYRHERNEERYVRFLYNQFIFSTDMATESLGEVNHGPADYRRSAVDTSDAANALSALVNYESLAQNFNSGESDISHVRQIAIFLSYVSLALVKQNPGFQTRRGIITMSPLSAKTLIFSIDHILMSNIRDSNIPTDKVSTVFDQIYNLIPQDFRSQHMLEFFYY